MRNLSILFEWIRESFLEEVLKIQVRTKQKKELERKYTS